MHNSIIVSKKYAKSKVWDAAMIGSRTWALPKESKESKEVTYVSGIESRFFLAKAALGHLIPIYGDGSEIARR